MRPLFSRLATDKIAGSAWLRLSFRHRRRRSFQSKESVATGFRLLALRRIGRHERRAYTGAAMIQIDTTSEIRWTLADFLSTYRFWALFVASLCVATASHSMSVFMPLVLGQAGISHSDIGIFFAVLQFGWIFGAVFAFMIVPRAGRTALIIPLLACGLLLGTVSFVPTALTSAVFLAPFGLAFGTLQTLFTFAAFVFLSAGRATKVDFASAAVIIGAASFLSFLAPVVGSLLFLDPEKPAKLILAMLGMMGLALIVLIVSRRLAFDDAPRPRHKPLTPKRRSPFLVVFLATLPLMVVAVVFTIVVAQRFSLFGSASMITHPLILLVPVLLILWAAYAAYWLFRIHGELAGAQASQRLLTPGAGLAIGLLAPLGLPVLLMTLGDLLNARARDAGKPRAVPIWAVGIFSILFSPIAMALIQHGANKSYAD